MLGFGCLFGLVQSAISLVLLGGLALTCVLSLVGEAPNAPWPADLANHFRLQYLVIQILGLLVLALQQWLKPVKVLAFTVLGFFLFLNASHIAPYYISKPHSTQAQLHTAKLLHLNVYTHTREREWNVIQLIRDTQPDLISLVEYTEDWRLPLIQSGVLNQYSHRVAGKGHMALYSKIPLSNSKLVYLNPEHPVANGANIRSQFNLNGKPVGIIVAHPPLPLPAGNLENQKRQYGQWMLQRKRVPKNLVIVGDLNATPWSASLRNLMRETGLRDSQLGFGLQPSWPAYFPPVMIPIDHVLVSEDIVVTSRKTLPSVGSDHLPVLIEFGVANSGRVGVKL